MARRATLLPYDFEERDGYWVLSTARAFERAMNDELAPHRITYRQWQVLVCLAHQGELSHVEVARLLGIEAPTLTGVIGRMERDGWIGRTPCPGDRRRKLLRPMPRVGPVWKRMVACARRVRARAARGLAPKRALAMRATLAILRDNLTAGPSARETD
ncbi:MAG: MarR family winged helix-turn-helix transcriptional regulator [Planctomycetaceae bacterium]